MKGQYDPKEHAKIIYEMKLHECLKFSEELYVTRVPGGWIYSNANNSVFVPYNDEFKADNSSLTIQEIPVCNEITNCEIDQW